MEFIHLQTLHHFITAYGYWAVFIVIALESSGLPLPGETTLVSAAIYAGTTHNLDITLVIVIAAAGAIVGDSLGYWVGREYGLRLLLKYGRYIRLDQPKLKLGALMFLRHGGKIVFFGRFIAILRVLAALLAGVNRYPWPRFVLFNASGGLVWAAVFGIAGYEFGKAINRFAAPFSAAAAVIALVMVIGGVIFLRRHEAELLAEAERIFPGPIDPHAAATPAAPAKAADLSSPV